MPFEEAIDKLGSQSPIGALLSSSEWADLPVELRENAFFSANVESVRFLQSAQDSLGDFIAGNVKTLDDGQTLLATGSRAAFVDQMQARLAAMGVQRGDGGIRDITSEARLKLIFDIKTQQAGDYGYWRQGMDPDVLNEFPAMRFIRVKSVKEPRLAHEGYEDQVFLKTDPIWWRVINKDFGVPWGPWGWGCGHDVEDVDRDEAQSLGLIKRGQTVAQITQANGWPNPSKFFNKNLQASANGIEPELLAKMKNVFGNKIVIDGDVIRWAQPAELPADLPPGPVTKPVSEAIRQFDITKASEKTFREMLGAIDSVHDDGVLPGLTVTHQVSVGSAGTYNRANDVLALRRNSVRDRELVIVHEIGHWIDWKGLPGSRLGYHPAAASEIGPLLAEWRQAVDHSQAIENIMFKPLYQQNPGYQNYLLKPRELWARSYSQYIALRGGNAKLLEQVRAIRDGKNPLMLPDTHWTDEDFLPIAEAIDKLFNELGWL